MHFDLYDIKSSFAFSLSHMNEGTPYQFIVILNNQQNRSISITRAISMAASLQQSHFILAAESTRLDSPILPHNKTTKKKKKNDAAFKETKQGFVDYDSGKHEVSTRISGLRKQDIPQHYRLRVEGRRFQKNWTVSEVVDMVLVLNLWEDIEGLLNHWVGRFARKNFPVLIRVLHNFLMSYSGWWLWSLIS